MNRRMTMLLRNWVVLALLIGFGLPARAGECPVGFDAMERLELLPVFLPSGTQTKQFITYDPDGKNRSGFFKRYEENGEYVFFDEIGPGFLCRQQMNVFFLAYTKFPNEEIRIRYYFDDEAKPRIDMTFAEFFGKGGNYKAPFTPPLAYFDEPRKGTYAILYYPFAFNKRLKITAYHAAGMKHYDAAWFRLHLSQVSAGHACGNMEGHGSRFPGRADAIRAHGRRPQEAHRRHSA